MNWETRPILVAEDNDDDYFIFERAVKKAKVCNPIRRVINGHEIIHYLSGISPYSDRGTYPFPYLLLLDLKLPLKHGFEVLEWIRQKEKTKVLPVVVFSSSQQPDDILKAYKFGANGFVSKSTSVEGLIELVAAVEAYWLKFNCTFLPT